MIDELEAPDLTDMGVGVNNSGGKLENYRDPLTTPIDREKHIKKSLELYKDSSNDVYFCGYGGSKGVNEWLDPTDETTAKEILQINQGKHPEHKNIGKKPVGASINYSEEIENYSKADEIDKLNLIYLDFDNRTGKPADKKKIGAIGEEVKKLAESKEIHPLVACSGSKGFSVLIPVPHIEVEDQKELSMKIKDFLLELDSGPKITEAEIDPKCSNLNRLVGIPGTINNKKGYRENPETNGGYQRFWMDYNLDVPIDELRGKNKEFLEKAILDREVETTTKEFENTDPEKREITETKEGWKKELIGYINNYGKNNEGLWTDGQRQFLALAISGFGAYYGIDQDEIKDIVIEVAKENKDEELKQRLKAVKSTYDRKKRFEEGKEEIPPTFMYHLKEILPNQEAQKIKKNWKKIIQVDQIDKDELKEKVFSLNKASWNCETEFVIFTQEINFESSDKKIGKYDTYEVPKELAEKLVEQKKASYNIWICQGKNEDGENCGEWYFQKEEPYKCSKCGGTDFEKNPSTEHYDIGDILLDNYRFATPKESIGERNRGDIHIYKRGVYKKNAVKGEIKEKVKELHHKVRQNTQNEVISHIASLTGVYEKQFGLSGNQVVLKNGIFDLKEEKLKPHDPNEYALNRINIEYNPEADCSTWKDYLKYGVPEPEERQLIKEFLGTILVDKKPHKKALILVGPTDAGKSTFIEIAQNIIGKENSVAKSPKELTQKWSKGKLRGNMLNFSDEVEEGKLHKLSILKRIIDGKEITGDDKNKPTYQFIPTCEHIFAANETPTANRKDDAFWNRWLVIEMPKTIPKEKQDKKLPEKIVDEREGIFNWMVEGYKSFMENGYKFTVDFGWKDARERWLSWGDSVQRFIEQCLNKEEGNKISSNKLHKIYSEFAEEYNLDVKSQKELTSAVKQIPYTNWSNHFRFGGKQKSGFKNIKVNCETGGTGGRNSLLNTNNNKDKKNSNSNLHAQYNKSTTTTTKQTKTNKSLNRSKEETEISSPQKALNKSVELVKKKGKISDKELEKQLPLDENIELKDFWFKLRRHNNIEVDDSNILHYTEGVPQKEKVETILEKLEDLQDGELVHHNDLVDKVDLSSKELEALIDKMKENKDISEPKKYHYKIEGR